MPLPCRATRQEHGMIDMEIVSPDTQDPDGLPDELSTEPSRQRTDVRILGLIVAHADEFLGVREDQEDPSGYVYAWSGVALTDHGKRLMGHLPENVGSLMINYESGRWQVQE